MASTEIVPLEVGQPPIVPLHPSQKREGPEKQSENPTHPLTETYRKHKPLPKNKTPFSGMRMAHKQKKDKEARDKAEASKAEVSKAEVSKAKVSKAEEGEGRDVNMPDAVQVQSKPDNP